MFRSGRRTLAAAPTRLARLVPLLYFGTAHVSLALACALAGVWPRAVAGFFYHSWMVAIVHLVTLGWITFSILGAMYLAGPIALRMKLTERKSDYAIYAAALVGVVGMVAHFWIEEYRGMAWSAGMVVCGVLWMTARIVRAVHQAAVRPATRRLITLACVNIWIAGSTGLLIACDKTAHVLPGFVLSNVFAHAHLAALGWATMMVVGVGSRLLPMVLPAKMPTGRAMDAAVILLETGVLGLFVALLLRSGWAVLFGLTFAAGLGVCASQVAWMLRHPVSRPVGVRSPDFALLRAAAAGLWLVVATLAGLALLVLPMSPRTLHLAAAYGAAGLVGFLAQIVAAMEARLLPMAVWFWAYAASGYRVPPPSPHTMRDRTLQAIVFAGWTAGVPLLTAGLFLESARLVGAGAWTLFAAVAVATLDNAFMLTRVNLHAYQDRPAPGPHFQRTARPAL